MKNLVSLEDLTYSGPRKPRQVEPLLMSYAFSCSKNRSCKLIFEAELKQKKMKYFDVEHFNWSQRWQHSGRTLASSSQSQGFGSSLWLWPWERKNDINIKFLP
jgi:hypothetical protein